MKLYVKVWCPWCIDAIDWLKNRGYRFEQIDVLANQVDYDHMKKVSGQSKTPTLELTTGQVLADFDVRQLENFLKTHNIQPE